MCLPGPHRLPGAPAGGHSPALPTRDTPRLPSPRGLTSAHHPPLPCSPPARPVSAQGWTWVPADHWGPTARTRALPGRASGGTRRARGEGGISDDQPDAQTALSHVTEAPGARHGERQCVPASQRLSKGGRGTQGPARLLREEARAKSWQRRGPGLPRLPGKRGERAVARPAGPKWTSLPAAAQLGPTRRVLDEGPADGCPNTPPRP